MPPSPLKLFNSLTRRLEAFTPIHPGTQGDPNDPPEARVYTCGPTVYNYPHIGNCRAYVFADVLGRVLSYQGYKLTHVINITDVGHLTDDADAGEDKLERQAAREARSIWDIAAHYTQAFKADIAALNIRAPSAWTKATDYVPAMIAFAQKIAPQHCYELPSGLYFDVSTVADYGKLAGGTHEAKAAALAAKAAALAVEAVSETDPVRLSELVMATARAAAAAQSFSRIDPVPGKRHPADFAIWRRTPPGETRQMEWDSPWGKGAPGWHLECSVMSGAKLGFPFDIHTGGIDHREIHHPCEIAQNQAFCGDSLTGGGGLDVAANSGANIWMHNNFLVDRRAGDATAKMSKSSGEFLRLQLLIDKGYHPLAFRMLCHQAHYRSELEFSWEGLGAALTRLKRLVMAVEALKHRHADLVSASMSPHTSYMPEGGWTLKRVQADGSAAAATDGRRFEKMICKVGTMGFEEALYDDLNTPEAVTSIEWVLSLKDEPENARLDAIRKMDSVLGLNLLTLTRKDLRIRPKAATITEEEIEAILTARKQARAAKDFVTSDALRGQLTAAGVEVMDGDPLGWEWKLGGD